MSRRLMIDVYIEDGASVPDVLHRIAGQISNRDTTDVDAPLLARTAYYEGQPIGSWTLGKP